MAGASLATAVGPTDFLALHRDGRSGTLEFGVTGVDVMPAHFTRTPHDLGVAVLTLVAEGELELVFDESGLLAAVNFGFVAGDLLPEGTLAALGGEDGPMLTFDGMELGRIARLADFAAVSETCGPFAITGRASDGWLRLSAENGGRVTRFEFLNRAENAPKQENHDYLLYGISVVSMVYETRLTGLMNSQYGEDPCPMMSS